MGQGTQPPHRIIGLHMPIWQVWSEPVAHAGAQAARTTPRTIAILLIIELLFIWSSTLDNPLSIHHLAHTLSH
jgi:hypothetical protein